MMSSRVMAVVALLFAQATIASAQKAIPDDAAILEHGQLLPPRPSSGMQTERLTPAQVQSARAVIDTIIAQFKKFPGITTPHGYDVRVEYEIVSPHGYRVSDDLYAQESLVRMGVRAGFFWYYVNENVTTPTRVPE